MKYSPDQEILSDLYDDFYYRKAEGIPALQAIGQQYLEKAGACQLAPETRQLIEDLSCLTQEDADRIEAVLLRAHILRGQVLEQEQREYDAFCMLFEGDTRNALKRIPRQLAGKTIPYRIREGKLHMDLFQTPAMRLGLDFLQVLVEDGHRPGSVVLSRIHAEKTEEGSFRFSFVSKTGEDPYPSRVHSFLFQEVKGELSLYDYAADPGIRIAARDKLPWRRILQKIQALTGKAQELGMLYLNDEEIKSLPVLTFFERLICFYLDPETEAGNRFSAIVFSQKKAADLGLTDAQIDAVRAFLPQKGCKVFLGRLDTVQDNLIDFCRFWIHYASTSQSVTLYRTLDALLTECGHGYPVRTLPKAYRDHHEQVAACCDSFFRERGWQGRFPDYSREITPKFVEVSSIYSKMYTYVNEKKKFRTVGLTESVSRRGYTVTAAGCDFLLKDGQNSRNLKAMDGYFTDGGRRNIYYIDSILIGAGTEEEETCRLLEQMLRKASGPEI